jgi:hypothetical protein
MTPILVSGLVLFIGITLGFFICAILVRHEIEDVQHKEKVVENQKNRVLELTELVEKKEQAVKGIAKATLTTLDIIKKYVNETQRKEVGLDDAYVALNNFLGE